MTISYLYFAVRPELILMLVDVCCTRDSMITRSVFT